MVAALVLAAASLSIDHFLIEDGAPFPIFSGQPDTARTILSLIATSVVTLTALVLTIVAVVIQLATQALSPRSSIGSATRPDTRSRRDTRRRSSIPSGWHADETGTPRLRVPAPTWDLYVALAFEEIRHHGAGTLQVMRRLRSAVEDLLGELPEHRHPALQRQIRMLDETVEWAFRSELERAAAVCPDAQGIGSGGGFDPIDESEQGDDRDNADDQDPAHGE